MVWVALIVLWLMTMFGIGKVRKEINHLSMENEQLKNQQEKLFDELRRLQHAHSETNPKRYASQHEFNKEKLKIEQVRMDLRDFMEICTGEIFGEEDAKKVHNWKWHRRIVLDDGDDF